MNIQKTNNKKIALIISTAVLVLVVAAGASLYLDHDLSVFGWNPFVPSAEAAKTQQEKAQQQEGDRIKAASVNPDGSKPNISGSDQPPSPTPNGNGKSTVTVAITAANQNGPTLQIRALIYALDSAGTCTLTLTGPGSASIQKTASTQALSNTSTCQGFDIPVSELAKGQWTLTLQYDSPTLTGKTSSEVTIT